MKLNYDVNTLDEPLQLHRIVAIPPHITVVNIKWLALRDPENTSESGIFRVSFGHTIEVTFEEAIWGGLPFFWGKDSTDTSMVDV